jgi:hypothetical protein
MSTYTDREAGQRWCPFARVPYTMETNTGDVGMTINRDGTYGGDRMPAHRGYGNECIGSRCAAWRWAEPATRTVTCIPAHMTPDRDTHDEPLGEARKGFCGLAVAPRYPD